MAHRPEFRAEVVDYATANPSESADSIGKLFSIPGRTVRRWLSSAGIVRSDIAERKAKSRKKPKKKEDGGARAAPEPSSRARNAQPLEKRGGRRPRARAPAEVIPRDDREEALSIVRRARSIAARYLDNFEEDLDRWEREMERIEEIEDPEERREAIRRNPIPRVNREETQALLNLQKTAAEVLDTHPGLLELGQATGPAPGEDEARRARVRAALGLGGPEE